MNGGGGGRRSMGGAVSCEMWMCVCVYFVLAFCVKAGGSALILLNNGVVPVLM